MDSFEGTLIENKSLSSIQKGEKLESSTLIRKNLESSALNRNRLGSVQNRNPLERSTQNQNYLERFAQNQNNLEVVAQNRKNLENSSQNQNNLESSTQNRNNLESSPQNQNNLENLSQTVDFLDSEITSKTSSKCHPDYVQTFKVKDSNGQVKELIFPKGLDLDRPKRARTTFTNEQLASLETEFNRNQYLVGRERTIFSTKLGLTETQVKVWYQNRRTKYKRDREREAEILTNLREVSNNACLSRMSPFPPYSLIKNSFEKYRDNLNSCSNSLENYQNNLSLGSDLTKNSFHNLPNITENLTHTPLRNDEFALNSKYLLTNRDNETNTAESYSKKSMSRNALNEKRENLVHENVQNSKQEKQTVEIANEINKESAISKNLNECDNNLANKNQITTVVSKTSVENKSLLNSQDIFHSTPNQLSSLYGSFHTFGQDNSLPIFHRKLLAPYYNLKDTSYFNSSTSLWRPQEHDFYDPKI